MALTGSGAITLDAMHVEAGGTTGDECTINDTDIIGLIDKTAGATMSFNEWYGASGEFYNFPITKSLRFNTGSSTYLELDSYTHNRQIFTYSFWFKPSNVTTRQFIFGRYVGGTDVSTLEYDGASGGNFAWYDYQSAGYLLQQRTTAKFRDPNAWYHVVLRVDTTDGTAGNRARMYVNGVEITSFSTETVVPQNTNFLIGDGGADFRWGTEGSNNRFFLSSYLADITVIDGTSYAPTAFAETKNDIWIPKDTAGLTFGNGGYRLEFKQTGTSQNSSGIGADTGGNNKHFSVSALAASDVVTDSPTNNFATYNPLAYNSQTNNSNFTEGNLKAIVTGGKASPLSFGMTSGKWYAEVRCSGGVHTRVGVVNEKGVGADLGGSANSWAKINNAARVYHNGSVTSQGAEWDDGQVAMVAIDVDAGKIWYGVEGTWDISGDPAAGNNPSQSSITGNILFLASASGSGTLTYIFNTGSDGTFGGAETAQGNADGNSIGDFYYSPPSGFLALCTANLPDPVATIDPAARGSPQDYFSADIFTGNGTNQDIDIGFVPNLVWTKQRTDNSGSAWMDSVRGTDAYFQTANNNAEGDFADITFTSSGYKVTGNDNLNNENAHNYVGWAWKAESAFSNDASSTSVGSIDSTGRVNTDVGISIVTYTGNGTAGASIAHGLGAEPKWIIAKRRNASGHWRVQHGALTYIRYMSLDNTGGTGGDEPGVWHRAPTTTVFSVGQDGPNVNNGLYIAYSFAEVDGFSSFPEYTGNGSTDGPFIYCGFRPAFTIIKREDTNSRSWIIQDHVRSPTNPIIIESDADAAARDYESNATGGYNIDYLSNGIKIRNTNVNWNADGGRYIVMAFAEQPFKYANAR